MESEKENGCYMWPDKQNPELFRSLESNTEILVTLKREEKKTGGTREETSLSLSRVERVDGTGLDRPNTLPNMMMPSTPRDLSSSGRSKSLKPAGDPNEIGDSTAQHSTQKKKKTAFTIEKIADDREKSLEKRGRVQLRETNEKKSPRKRTRKKPQDDVHKRTRRIPRVAGKTTAVLRPRSLPKLGT
jgi:hypothetical protein